MMKKSLYLEGKNSEKLLSMPAPPPLSSHMVVAGIMGEAKIGPWSPIELAVLFWMLGHLKKNNGQTQELLGNPSIELSLSNGPKMAKNTNFGFKRRKFV